MAAASYRAARSVVHHVYDAARWGIHAYHSVVRRVYTYAVRTYHAVTTYARHVYRRAIHTVRTVYHAARRIVHRARDAVVKAARSVVHHVVSAAKSAARHVAAAGVWAGRHVQKAASVAVHFAARNAAAIGGAVTGIAVFAGCEAVTAGAGSLACAAASGAAANAVSYAISAAQKGSFSWSALGKTTALGAAEGLAGGALGEAASAAGGAIMSTLARGGADEATTMASEEGGQAAEDASSCVVGGQSFTASTRVLTATGALVAISKLAKGEKVLAASTRTGKNQAEPVAAVLVHHDTDLYDLKVRSGGVTSVIATTSNHLFWVPGTHRWVKAAALRHGTHLRTPAGTSAIVTGGYTPRHHNGWMWDLTIQDDHDFYVLPASDNSGTRYQVDQTRDTAVLVHNCDNLSDIADKVQGALKDARARHGRTVGIMQASDGRMFAANAGDSFTSAQLRVLEAEGRNVGRQIVPLPFMPGMEAEVQLMDYAARSLMESPDAGLFPIEPIMPAAIGASRTICSDICRVAIENSEFPGLAGRILDDGKNAVFEPR